MQKPDKDGYVYVTWPSKTIPHGGIFHTRRAEPTPKQQEFLKVLIEESKLDIAQREKSKRIQRQEEERSRAQPQMEVQVVRPRTSRRRSLSAIRQSGIYDVDPYKPLKRGEDREKLKEKLAKFMAYGDSGEQVPPPPPRLPKSPPKMPTEKEKWHDLITQIRERATWLAEMEDLGQAEPHRQIIEEQIAERLRALDALGVDSECSSVRSGFSTLRSKPPTPTVQSNVSVKSKTSAKSDKSPKMSAKAEPVETRRSTASQEKPLTAATTPGKKASSRRTAREILTREENVSAYSHLPPLQYSPRRRV